MKWDCPPLPVCKLPTASRDCGEDLLGCDTGQALVQRSPSLVSCALPVSCSCCWEQGGFKHRRPGGLRGSHFLCPPWRTSRVAPSCSPHGPRPALRLTWIAGHGPSFSTLQALLRSAEAVSRDSQPQGQPVPGTASPREGSTGRRQLQALRPGSPKPGGEEGADKLAG